MKRQYFVAIESNALWGKGRTKSAAMKNARVNLRKSYPWEAHDHTITVHSTDKISFNRMFMGIEDYVLENGSVTLCA